MESKQLRIGNYIMQSGNVTMVESLSRSIDDWDRTNHKRTMDCEPILLTEEWLLKFGFVHQYKNKIGQDFFECIIDAEFKLYVNLNRMNISLSKKYVGNVYSKKLQYVHQLQNLYFALTGEELTIKQN